MLKSGKYISKISMHLGCIKYSIGIGTILDVNLSVNTIIINGRTFNDLRDIEILYNHDWIVEYTEKEEKEIKKKIKPQPVSAVKEAEDKKRKPMTVIKSDRDQIDDIVVKSVTKKTDETVKAKDKNAPLKVIRQEESVQTFSGESLNKPQAKKASDAKAKAEAAVKAAAIVAERKKRIAKNLAKKKQDMEVEVLSGAELVEEAGQIGAETIEQAWKEPMPK